jgi:hypothetical protein
MQTTSIIDHRRQARPNHFDHMSTERTPLQTIHALVDATEQIAALKAALSRKDAEIEALRNPWISVHDRLPENDDTVFVMLDYYQADMDGPDVVGLSSSGEYDTGSLFDGAVLADHFNDDDVDVTHWMPLPSQTKP